ncbi:hypothetical protein AnigIFM59636_006938 [Aspergillus niger]|nr:hypothetical protein AnigIFM59636_006938 [Aspergillus niger]
MLMAGYLPSLLADTAQLKSGVKAFFEEFAHFFPCLQLDEFCPRLFNLFQICPSGPHGLLLPIEREIDYHSHQTWYRESQRLRLRHPERPLRDLDILPTYIVEAIYKLGLERLSESSQSIAQAVELAFALGLNNERC